jgi:hypothetical protein
MYRRSQMLRHVQILSLASRFLSQNWKMVWKELIVWRNSLSLKHPEEQGMIELLSAFAQNDVIGCVEERTARVKRSVAAPCDGNYFKDDNSRYSSLIITVMFDTVSLFNSHNSYYCIAVTRNPFPLPRIGGRLCSLLLLLLLVTWPLYYELQQMYAFLHGSLHRSSLHSYTDAIVNFICRSAAIWLCCVMSCGRLFLRPQYPRQNVIWTR